MLEAAIVGRVGAGSLKGLEDQISKWLTASGGDITDQEIKRLAGRKFAQPFKQRDVLDAISRTRSRLGLHEAEERTPELDTMHTQLTGAGLEPQVKSSADGPDFEFGTEEEAKKAAEILMKAGYGIRANNRQGKTYRVSASWNKDLSEADRDDIQPVYGWLTPENEWIQADYLGHDNAVLWWYLEKYVTTPQAKRIFHRIREARHRWKVMPEPEEWIEAGLPPGDYSLIRERSQGGFKIYWRDEWAFARGWVRSTGHGLQVPQRDIPDHQLKALQERYSRYLPPRSPGAPQEFYIDYGAKVDDSQKVPYLTFLYADSMRDLYAPRRREPGFLQGPQFFQPESVGATVLDILNG
ncbi:hypothetical protein LCGC14_0165240 [marine sediment metagenome]|uniref:Uncharacterized protein n=1 Tax=marine sediment metagenome TaxID=412755 RepID=A0A0F9UV17_9ZZZZ